METILLMVLVGAAGGVIAGLAGLGLLQRHRRLGLERRANESGLHFCAEDTFDVPGRYASFALCSAGHSPQASNVTYGRVRGLPVRAFDFRYEVAHGTHRGTRHYGAVLVEAGPEAWRGSGAEALGARSPGVLMWNLQDAARAPVAALPADGEYRQWSWRGDEGLARRMGDLCEKNAPAGLSVEVREGGMLFAFPMPRRRGARRNWLEAMAPLLEALSREWGEGPSGPPQNAPAQAVENLTPPC